MNYAPAESPRRIGRRPRGEADTSKKISPISPGMVGGQYKPLTDSETLRIHHLALQLLEELGLSQITPSLERRAVAAGCRMDNEGRLHFPRSG